MLPSYLTRGGTSGSNNSGNVSSGNREPTSPNLSPPLCSLSSPTSTGSTTSLSSLSGCHHHHRRRFQLPTILAPLQSSDATSISSSSSLIPQSSSASTLFSASSLTSPGTGNNAIISKKQRSLRDVFLDRAAPLFPSILIMSLGLLLVLHLLTPATLDFFTTAPTSTHSHLPLSALTNATSLFSNFLPNQRSDEATTARLSQKDLVVELERWKDPAYSSERLRVYFYDLPSLLNAQMVRDSHTNPPKLRDPYCDENFYSAEHTIAEFFRKSAVRTYNASEADFFYVPIYATCYLLTHQPNDVNMTGAFFSQAMNHVIHEHPYWNASDGRDHLLMFAQGFGARLSGDWKQYRHSTFLVHNGDYEEDHFDTHKDIVVPPDLSHYLTPVGLEHPNKLLMKKNFVLFGGQVVNTSISDHRGSNYSGGVRQYVQEHLSGVDDYKVTGVRSTTYIDDMKDSVFCLAPHGWHKWSPRPAYAVLLGCVPVIVSERQTLFLENLIDYDRISFWVRPEEIMLMDEKLRMVSAKTLTEMEKNMRLIWRLFWYGDEGLAKEAILYSLYRKLGGGDSRQERIYI